MDTLSAILTFLALGVLFSFALAYRGFSAKGFPLTSSARLTGVAAKRAGIACFVVGLLCLLLCVIVFRMLLSVLATATR